jgi:ubiquitin carboxyl-terminal hydrolase 22/27/51
MEALKFIAILQRFEHKTTDKSSAQKIDAPIRFPASLNMAPYTTLVMNLKTNGMEKENEHGGVPTLS